MISLYYLIIILINIALYSSKKGEAYPYYYRSHYNDRTIVICNRGSAYFPENSKEGFITGAT